MKTLKIMNFTPSLTRTAWYQMTHGPVPVWSPLLLLHFSPLLLSFVLHLALQMQFGLYFVCSHTSNAAFKLVKFRSAFSLSPSPN